MHTKKIVALALGAVLLTGCSDQAEDTSTPAPAGTKSASGAPSATPSGPEALVLAVDEEGGQDAQSAAVKVGQLVHLDLGTCGGCGFLWEVTKAPDAKVATEDVSGGSTTEPSPAASMSGPPLVGAPTTTRISFLAVAAGTTSAEIAYRGPDGKTERTITLTLTVTA